MSMVAKIVKALGGKVDVQSEKDVGTLVTVTVPLDMSYRSTDTSMQVKQQPLLSLSSRPLSMDFLGPSVLQEGNLDKNAAARSTQLTAIFKTVSELNIAINPPAWTLSNGTDLAMVFESDVPHVIDILQAPQEPKGHAGLSVLDLLRSKPLLVICRDYMSLRRMKGGLLGPLLNKHVEYVAQPCGPERLTRAIRTCLASSVGATASTGKLVAATTSQISTPRPILTSRATQQRDVRWLRNTPTTAFLRPQTELSQASSEDSASKRATELAKLSLQNKHSPSIPKPQLVDTTSEYPFPNTPTKRTTSDKAINSAVRTGNAKTRYGGSSTITQPELSLLLVDDNVRISNPTLRKRQYL